MGVGHIDRRELEARRLVGNWGVSLTTAHHRPVSPCPRAHCHGSLLSFGDDGGSRCLLCARSNGDTAEDYAAEAAVQELMMETPGPWRSLRASLADRADGLPDL